MVGEGYSDGNHQEVSNFNDIQDSLWESLEVLKTYSL